MFRIECFCDDKNLAKLLWSLTAMGAYNVSSLPVANAEKGIGNILKGKTSHGTKMELFKQWLIKHKLHEVTPSDIKEFMKESGFSIKNYSNTLSYATKTGLLRRVGSEFRYRVILKTSKKMKSTKRKLKVVTSNPQEAA